MLKRQGINHRGRRQGSESTRGRGCGGGHKAEDACTLSFAINTSSARARLIAINVLEPEI